MKYISSFLCSNGSVKVIIFRVKVNASKPSNQSDDVMKFGRRFDKQLKTGHIGNIKIVPDAVRLKGILD